MRTDPSDLDIAAFILQTVCQEWHLEPADLESPDRPWRLVWPRWCAIFLIAKYTRMPHSVIGALLNRSIDQVRGIIHRSMPSQLDTDEHSRQKLFQLEAYILAYTRRPSASQPLPRSDRSVSSV
jgi:hypothetical protein